MLRIRSLLMPVLLLPMVHADETETAVSTNGPAEALVSGFLLPPVHWDKNISVVDVCGSPLQGVDNVVEWPDTTGELLKLMDALKYEYELKYFQCVVFSLDSGATGAVADKMLQSLLECVTACDMLKIPVRLALRKGENWVEVAPTYTSQTASHLMLGEDASFRLFSEESLLMFSGQSVAELETQLKSLAEKDTVVNLFWKPTAGNMASFVQLIELCNSLEVGYALYIEP